VVERCLSPLPSARPKDASEALLLFQKTPGLLYRRPLGAKALGLAFALLAFALAYVLLGKKNQDTTARARSEATAPVVSQEHAALPSAAFVEFPVKATAESKADSSAKSKVLAAPHVKAPQASTASTASRTDLLYGH
jgi:hypothetical protein